MCFFHVTLALHYIVAWAFWWSLSIQCAMISQSPCVFLLPLTSIVPPLCCSFFWHWHAFSFCVCECFWLLWCLDFGQLFGVASMLVPYFHVFLLYCFYSSISFCYTSLCLLCVCTSLNTFLVWIPLCYCIVLGASALFGHCETCPLVLWCLTSVFFCVMYISFLGLCPLPSHFA